MSTILSIACMFKVACTQRKSTVSQNSGPVMVILEHCITVALVCHHYMYVADVYYSMRKIMLQKHNYFKCWSSKRRGGRCKDVLAVPFSYCTTICSRDSCEKGAIWKYWLEIRLQWLTVRWHTLCSVFALRICGSKKTMWKMWMRTNNTFILFDNNLYILPYT